MTVVLKVWSRDQQYQYHLRNSLRGKLTDPSPGLLIPETGVAPGSLLNAI